MNKKRAILWLFAALLWTGVIFLFSSQSYVDSNNTSMSVATFLSNLLIPDFSSWGPSSQAEWLSGINNLLRKIAHISEFALLGVLTYLTLLNLSGRTHRKKPPTKLGLGMISFYICVVLSALDELHQTVSAGRTPSTGDMLIDCAGVILGIIICSYKTRLPGPAPQQRLNVRRRG